MALRPCLTCGTPTRGRRCPAHARPTSSVGQGYGAAHRQARARLATTLPAPCGYGCGRTITAATFVTAHVIDGDPSAGWIASCRSCNEHAKIPGRLDRT